MNLQDSSTPPGSQPGGAIRVRSRQWPVLLAWAIGVVLALWFFSAFRLMLLGVLAAAAVASALWPIVVRMRRRRALAAVSVGIGFVAVVATVVAIIVLLLSEPISREVQRIPQTRQALDQRLASLSQRMQVSPPIDTNTLLDRAGSWLGRGDGLASTMGSTLVNVGVALAFIFIGSIYFLAEPRDNLIGPPLRALPSRRRAQVVAAMDELGPKLRGWLIGVLVSMSVVAVISGIGYSIAGLNFAIPLALLAGLCELVPTIGPIVGGVVALLAASTQGTGEVVGAGVTWAVVQTVESYVLLPLVMKQAVEMPAVVTLFTVILWGEVFGAAGLFMAIPVNLLIWTLFKHLVIEDQEQRPMPAPATSPAEEIEEAAAHPT